MYCPKCATQLSDEQKFCRSCGLDLQVVSQILTSESQTVGRDETESQTIERSQSRKAKLQRRSIITIVSSLLVGCLIPICLGLFSKWAGLNQLVLVLSGLAGFLLFTGCILLLYSDGVSETQVDGEPSKPSMLGQAKQTNKLPLDDGFESVAGFDERTTDLLNRSVSKGSRKGA